MKVNVGIRLVGEQHQARLLLAGVEQPPNLVLPLRASELAEVLKAHLLQGYRIGEAHSRTTSELLEETPDDEETEE